MRILYDGVVFSTQRYGGVSRYFQNLISNLPLDFQPSITLCNSVCPIESFHPNLKLYTYNRFSLRPGRLSYWWEKHYFRNIESRGKYKLIHPTDYTLLSRQDFEKTKRPIVLTIYDMIHELFAEQMSFDKIHVFNKLNALKVAHQVICISQSTKNDLLNIYPFLEGRTSVVHLATNLSSRSLERQDSSARIPYFMHVGGRSNYKNFTVLLKSFSNVLTYRKDVMLYVVGAPWVEDEVKLINELSISQNVVLFKHLSDDELAALYAGSLALIYPSLYEGFGLPPLEAMACETVVVAANTSSIPEVVGDAGILFNPYLADELADIMLSLLRQTCNRERLIEKGYEQAQKFSWQKTSEQTATLYRTVC